MGSSQKVVSGVIWTILNNVVNAIYGFVAVPILINYFGKAQYGLIGLAMSINVYMQLMDMGFNNTNVRFFSNWLANCEYGNVKKAFQTSLSFYGIIGLINALILIILSLFSDSIFNVTPEQDVILKDLFYILAVSAFVHWYSSCFDQLIRATENVAWIQKRSFIPKILMIVVLSVTVFCELNIEEYYILTCMASFIIVPWSISKIKKLLPFISFCPRPDKIILKKMLPYCLNIFSFAIFQFSFYNLRPVFLGMQGSVESVADYRILNGIVGLVSMVSGAFLGALLPSSSKVVAEGNKEAYYKIAYQGTRYVSIVICFCSFGLMSVGPELISLYVGKEFLYLIPWMNLWLICILGGHNKAISTLILAGDDIRAISYSSATASIIGLISTWILIPFYGVGGTVLAFCLYEFIQMFFYYTYWWPKKMNINSWKVFANCFLPSVLIGSFISLIVNQISFGLNNWAELITKGLFFAIFFVLFSFIAITKEDKSFLLGIISRKENQFK